ncbi:MAG TPA: heme exporter protein CcmD [Stellaceae bacterium]|nr:heme exporter protein CcmD [Stellaceae bacterium]
MSGAAAFFAMGGYARYVWPAYGIAFLTLGGLALRSWLRHRASRKALDALDRRAGAREGAR